MTNGPKSAQGPKASGGPQPVSWEKWVNSQTTVSIWIIQKMILQVRLFLCSWFSDKRSDWNRLDACGCTRRVKYSSGVQGMWAAGQHHAADHPFLQLDRRHLNPRPAAVGWQGKHLPQITPLYWWKQITFTQTLYLSTLWRNFEYFHDHLYFLYYSYLLCRWTLMTKNKIS